MGTRTLPAGYGEVQAQAQERRRRPRGQLNAARMLLITLALAFLALFLGLPLIVVFTQALSKGWHTYLSALTDPNAIAAIKLTVTVAAIAVPLNVLFGVAASWAIAKFDFRGKSALISLIDLPFAVSPVISGLIYVLMFGANGWFGAWLSDHDVQIIFAVPGELSE